MTGVNGLDVTEGVLSVTEEDERVRRGNLNVGVCFKSKLSDQGTNFREELFLLSIPPFLTTYSSREQHDMLSAACYS